MIKINLLPKSIYEKNAVRNTAILFGVLFVAIVAGCLTFTMMKRGQVAQMEAAGNTAASMQAEIKKIKDDTAAVIASIGPIQQKLEFIKAVHECNNKWPALCEEIAKWTYERVSLSSLQFTNGGLGVSMQIRVKTLDDLGRYLMNMYRATDLFKSVSISSLPGYPAQSNDQGGQGMPMPGDAGMEMPSGNMGGAGLGAIEAGVVSRPESGWFTVQVDCELKNPIAAPSAAGAAAGAAGAPQPGGMPGGAPSPTMPMSPPSGT